MDPITAAAAPPPTAAPPTAAQQQALSKLHVAAQQMESLFVDMLFKEMRKATPTVSLTGKTSEAEQTFGEMLDTKRADELAKTGSLGIGKMLEMQLRGAVVPDAPAASTLPLAPAAPVTSEKKP